MWKLTVFLSIAWALTLLYGEWFAFLVPSMWTCSWPHLHRSSSSSTSSSLNGVDQSNNYVKIAVITDPQLMDRTSLPLASKSLALEIAQFYTDLNMRRAFLLSVLPFNPDVILFLGDYFDGGNNLSDEEFIMALIFSTASALRQFFIFSINRWQESFSRFRHIFNINMLQQSSNIKVYHLSGNHDTGYAAVISQKPEIIKRYEREFGARNFKVTLGKVDFIAVDAQTLDGNPHSNLTSAAWNFIRNVSRDNGSTPRVLMTHIPLYRPDWSPCGPRRSSPIINQRIYPADGNQEIFYQNYITENSTKDLIDLIKPTLVLSGHDHDQCTFTHMSKYGPVIEHTIGTVSWQQGNLYPSFMLLSAYNSTSSDVTNPKEAILTHLCFLPMQTHIYLWYLSLFVMTLIIVLLGPANEVFIFHKLGALIGYIRKLFDFGSFINSMKEKNEDENCEYEEIWDAEGSMHLIKKTAKVPPTLSNERNTMERGNVVMRSAARKQVAPETDVSVRVDLDVKLPLRTNRSKAKLIIWRSLRTLRALMIVAAINFPLYVLLVFKDWIDK